VIPAVRLAPRGVAVLQTHVEPRLLRLDVLQQLVLAWDETCPVSTGGGTRRVRLVREEGRGVSSQYRREGGGGGANQRRDARALVHHLEPRAVRVEVRDPCAWHLDHVVHRLEDAPGLKLLLKLLVSGGVRVRRQHGARHGTW